MSIDLTQTDVMPTFHKAINQCLPQIEIESEFIKDAAASTLFLWAFRLKGIEYDERQLDKIIDQLTAPEEPIEKVEPKKKPAANKKKKPEPEKTEDLPGQNLFFT